jgi:taurine dioxygenase
MSLQFRNLSENIGSEVIGINLAGPISKDDMQMIEQEFNNRAVLLFRNQDVSEEQHINFSKYFGELEIHVLKQYLLPENPEILRISNIQENKVNVGISDAGQYWHTDLSYMKSPSRCSILNAKVIPERKGEISYGDTCFINTASAYDALDAETKQRIKNLKSVHSYADRHERMRLAANSQRQPLTADQLKKVPEVIHPVVRTHPITGRKSIYVNEGFTTRIVDMDPAEGNNLLQELYSHCTSDVFKYRHKWMVGDIIMWDNCSTQHLAIADYGSDQLRLMYRTTVMGSEVF